MRNYLPLKYYYYYYYYYDYPTKLVIKHV